MKFSVHWTWLIVGSSLAGQTLLIKTTGGLVTCSVHVINMFFGGKTQSFK